MKGRHVRQVIIARIIQVRVLALNLIMLKEADGLVLEVEPRQRMVLRLRLLNPRLKPNVLARLMGSRQHPSHAQA